MMIVEIKIPSVGESISEVEIGDWLKSEGESVGKDERLVIIESDKATMELPAPVSGTVARIQKRAGEKAAIGEIIGAIEQDGRETQPASGDGAKTAQVDTAKSDGKAAPPVSQAARPANGQTEAKKSLGASEDRQGDRETKARASAPPLDDQITPPSLQRGERAVPLTPLRRAVAKRLVEAQRNAALLTTFNEVDMATVKRLREEQRQHFEERHGARLGFMSFFVKAAVAALRLVPQLNAELRGDALVYRDYYDVGIAVGSGKGLVVPVLRHAEALSFADIEKAIGDFARRAQDNQLKPEELANGTFTISNGGIYGSLLSTPIVNPPQSGILGMHAIVDRPVAHDGVVVIRPMMYIALTYDHRVVDGREAVTFLKTIKESIENPLRLLLDL
jgi:2-oxoglutarate dehydrogenase E2 component (dihydrolipoamide succinyltransferase)